MHEGQLLSILYGDAMKDRMPWMKFYPQDYLADPQVRMCSFAARGLWLEMLCHMYRLDERGVLAVNGAAWTDEQVLRATGCGDEGRTWLAELESNGVFSRNASGAIFSRRMVRDQELSKINTTNGSKGGNASLKSTSVNPPVNPCLKPPVKGGVKARCQMSESDTDKQQQITSPALPSASGSGFALSVSNAALTDKVIPDPLTEPAVKTVNRPPRNIGSNGLTFAMMLDIWYEEVHRKDNKVHKGSFQKFFKPKEGLWTAVKDCEPLRFRSGVKRYLDDPSPFFAGHPPNKFITNIMTFLPMNDPLAYDPAWQDAADLAEKRESEALQAKRWAELGITRPAN